MNEPARAIRPSAIGWIWLVLGPFIHGAFTCMQTARRLGGLHSRHPPPHATPRTAHQSTFQPTHHPRELRAIDYTIASEDFWYQGSSGQGRVGEGKGGGGRHQMTIHRLAKQCLLERDACATKRQRGSVGLFASGGIRYIFLLLSSTLLPFPSGKLLSRRVRMVSVP